MSDLLERLRAALGDRYAIESEIGRGGMAVVFLAEDLKHHFLFGLIQVIVRAVLGMGFAAVFVAMVFSVSWVPDSYRSVARRIPVTQ